MLVTQHSGSLYPAPVEALGVSWQCKQAVVGKAGCLRALLSLEQSFVFKPRAQRQLQPLPAALYSTVSSHSQQVPQPLPAVCHSSGSWLCACPAHPASSQLALLRTGSWERLAGSRAVDMSHNGQKWEDCQETAGGLEQSLFKKKGKQYEKIGQEWEY